MQLSDFIEYVELDLVRVDKRTEIVQAYNDAIVWVATLMPHGSYKYQCYVSTSVGIEDYALPSNLIHLMHPIRLLLGSGAADSGYPLDHLTKEQYDEIEPNPNWNTAFKGRPQKYCIFSRSILVTPKPDVATYYLEINHTKRPVALSEDNELSYLGSEWDEVLKWATLERVTAGLGLFDDSAFWGAKYHAIGPGGKDMPVGMAQTLFDIEKDREDVAIGQVRNNNL